MKALGAKATETPMFDHYMVKLSSGSAVMSPSSGALVPVVENKEEAARAFVKRMAEERK